MTSKPNSLKTKLASTVVIVSLLSLTLPVGAQPIRDTTPAWTDAVLEHIQILVDVLRGQTKLHPAKTPAKTSRGYDLRKTDVLRSPDLTFGSSPDPVPQPRQSYFAWEQATCNAASHPTQDPAGGC